MPNFQITFTPSDTSVDWSFTGFSSISGDSVVFRYAVGRTANGRTCGASGFTTADFNTLPSPQTFTVDQPGSTPRSSGDADQTAVTGLTAGAAYCFEVTDDRIASKLIPQEYHLVDLGGDDGSGGGGDDGSGGGGSGGAPAAPPAPRIALRFTGRNADGQPMLAWAYSNLDYSTGALYRHRTGCGFVAGLLADATMLGGASSLMTFADATGVTHTDATAAAGENYYYAFIAVDTDTTRVASNCVSTASANDATDEAILPSVIRGINSGIFNRILQRQREDGRWK